MMCYNISFEHANSKTTIRWPGRFLRNIDYKVSQKMAIFKVFAGHGIVRFSEQDDFRKYSNIL
ncbi:hypothetical protein B7P43_G18001 [Cryptotermes secundus]|uniref:Uncharacterized protein n=1 Tax=Cryptotermes secundus TaxID=105785 RepID=A0A2J7Q191_9NEOP|nr:hypothetical protein B7P43_G18001 [Cryptotermes secundus]